MQKDTLTRSSLGGTGLAEHLKVGNTAFGNVHGFKTSDSYCLQRICRTVKNNLYI